MYLDIELDLVLIKCEDMPGTLAVWIPQLDIMTQGDGVGGAIAMGIDAAEFIVHDSLSAFRSEDVPKCVRHPGRLVDGASVESHENYADWRRLRDLYGGRQADPGLHLMWVDEDTFERISTRVGLCIVHLSVITNRGVISVVPDGFALRHAGVYVPGRSYEVQYDVKTTRTTTVSIPDGSTADPLTEAAARVQAYGDDIRGSLRLKGA